MTPDAQRTLKERIYDAAMRADDLLSAHKAAAREALLIVKERIGEEVWADGAIVRLDELLTELQIDALVAPAPAEEIARLQGELILARTERDVLTEERDHARQNYRVAANELENARRDIAQLEQRLLAPAPAIPVRVEEAKAHVIERFRDTLIGCGHYIHNADVLSKRQAPHLDALIQAVRQEAVCGICEAQRSTHELESVDYTGPICDDCHPRGRQEAEQDKDQGKTT